MRRWYEKLCVLCNDHVVAMKLQPWKLDLRRRASIGWEDQSPVMHAVQVCLVEDSKHKNAGTVRRVVLDLEHLKLLPSPGRPLPRIQERTDGPGRSFLLSTPGHYHCVSEGSFGEPLVVVVTVRAIGVLKDKEDFPVFYRTEEEALVALAAPLLLKGPESQQDLAISLMSEGTAALNRGRVVLAENRWTSKGLPALSGTLKQIAWASTIRDDAVEQITTAEKSRGKERDKIAALLSPHRWLRQLWALKETPTELAQQDELETLTFSELRGELQHAVDAEIWIRFRSELLRWLSRRALARRKRPEHPF